MKLIIAALALCGLVACATPQTRAPVVSSAALEAEAAAQKRFVIEQRLDERRRVARIYLALSKANLEFCKNRSRSIGVEFHSLGRYGKAFKDAASAIGLTDAPTVGVVGLESPAAQAGVQSGDIVLALDSKTIPASLAGVRRLERSIADWDSTRPIPLTIKRGEQKIEIAVPSEEICGFPVQIAESDELNAFADGRVVVLQRGMLRFFQNDNEMALVLGHELAHNSLGHIDAQRQNQMAGMAGGLVLDVLLAAATGYSSDTFMRAGGQAGAQAFSAEFENEADYAGMYFMARAGFPLENVENFWRRMAVEAPGAIKSVTTHPTTPQRFLTLAATRDEIQARKLAGLDLKPRLKSDGQISGAAMAKADYQKKTGADEAAAQTPAAMGANPETPSVAVPIASEAGPNASPPANAPAPQSGPQVQETLAPLQGS